MSDTLQKMIWHRKDRDQIAGAAALKYKLNLLDAFGNRHTRKVFSSLLNLSDGMTSTAVRRASISSVPRSIHICPQVVDIRTATAISIYQDEILLGKLRYSQQSPSRWEATKPLSLMRPGTHSYDGPQTEPPLQNGTVKLPGQRLSLSNF